MSIETKTRGRQGGQMRTPKRNVVVTDHVRNQRWAERGDGNYNLKKAIDESIPVGLNRTTNVPQKGLYHPPTNTIFIIKKDNGEKLCTTVLDYRKEKQNKGVNTDHLDKCPICSRLYKPKENGNDECLFCGWGTEKLTQI